MFHKLTPVCAIDGTGEVSIRFEPIAMMEIEILGQATIKTTRELVGQWAPGHNCLGSLVDFESYEREIRASVALRKQEAIAMLVLSRRAEQQLVFPNLGITVKVLQIRGRVVKIGIEAPQDVKVLRPEACVEGELDSGRESRQASHRIRNQINLLQLKIQALQKSLELGKEVDAEAVLATLVDQTNLLDHQFSPTGAPALPDASGRAKRLLVVEDCDNERRLMAYLLATQGFDVDVARDGTEALHQLRTGFSRPQIVLMDMQMPLCDGLETLQKIREDAALADLKVYAVTGTARSPEYEPIGHGWDGWFQKPLDVEALLRQVSGKDCNADLVATTENVAKSRYQ